MIVCICHRVSDRDIARAVQAGCASFEELQRELSVATACGRCHDCARETFHAQACQVTQAPVGLASGAAAACPPARRIAVMPVVQEAAQAIAA